MSSLLQGTQPRRSRVGAGPWGASVSIGPLCCWASQQSGQGAAEEPREPAPPANAHRATDRDERGSTRGSACAQQSLPRWVTRGGARHHVFVGSSPALRRGEESSRPKKCLIFTVIPDPAVLNAIEAERSALPEGWFESRQRVPRTIMPRNISLQGRGDTVQSHVPWPHDRFLCRGGS